ncbi:MAG: ABC transporter substrate-binding protein, partial [Candidatus Izemoplasmatales bacterium]
FRFAFNIGGGVSYQINPILIYPEFRQAFYFSIDRSTLCSDVRAPSFPTHGLLGPVYLSTEYNSIPYRGSDAGVSVLADYSPESNGYDPVRAKELFDTAYALAVAADAIEDGDLVTVEYKFYDVETNWQIANWIKSQMETTFNAGEASPIFQLSLAAVSSTALDTDWDNKDFEVTFGGWQGLNFDAPSMLGQVYNSADTETMLESGFDTENAVLTVSLPNSKVALQAWVANYETVYAEYLAWDGETEPAPLVQPSVTAQENYDGWKAMLLKFDGDILTCTYNELFHYAYTELYNVADVNYTGKTDDFDNITGALEGELLRQMINIPLFTTVSATTYSDRIVFEANAYHAWMAWGGLKYMYIASELEE